VRGEVVCGGWSVGRVVRCGAVPLVAVKDV
jgi:hypothetical protein